MDEVALSRRATPISLDTSLATVLGCLSPKNKTSFDELPGKAGNFPLTTVTQLCYCVVMEKTPRSCLGCGTQFTPPRQAKHCSTKCRDRYNNQRRYYKWKDAGLCPICGRNPSPADRVYCYPCRTRYPRVPGASRAKQLKARYGVSLAWYDDQFRKQLGVCAICHKSAPGNLHVDHDHQSGTVRGLLCRKCNTALGWFERLKTSVISYLGRYS